MIVILQAGFNSGMILYSVYTACLAKLLGKTVVVDLPTARYDSIMELNLCRKGE